MMPPGMKSSRFGFSTRGGQLRDGARGVTTVLLVLTAIMAGGCGAPFNIKTRADMPAPNYAAPASAGAVTLNAQALLDEDLLFDTFDANLILAGVLSVRVKLTSSG